MAFGDLKGSLEGSGVSITNPSSIGGSVSVAVGDLIFALFAAQTTLPTISAVNDNLGNTYTAQNAGSDAGVAAGRAFYSRVTNAGTLTQIDFTCTTSSNNFASCAVVIEGPFTDPPIDKNPANTTADNTSPFSFPATGVLTQADEVVCCWIAKGSDTTLTSPTSPLLLGEERAITNIYSGIHRETVAATTSVAAAATCAVNPGACVLGTASFMKAAAAIPIPAFMANYRRRRESDN